MSTFAMVISALLNPQDTNKTSIILDTVNDDSVQLNSTITIHPIASGDMLADHMYNNPSSMSVNGSFSLNGSKAIIVDKNNVSFQETQEIFEKIKKEGILCDIVKVQIDNEKDGTQKPRFKIRNNMALTNIAWVEKINTLDFSFTFQQVLLADVEIATIDPDDGFLPNVTEPNTLSFTEAFMNLEDVTKLVINELQSYNLIEEGFLAFLAGNVSLIGVGIVIAAAAAAFIVSNPVGWVLGAVAVIGAGIAWFFGKITKNQRYKIKKFEMYNDSKKNEKEAKRFTEFIDSIYQEVKKLDNKINAYNVGKNEPQECLLSIDGNYYDFLFERSGSENPYSLKIKDMNENLVGQISNVESCPEDINQATSSKLVFQTRNTDTYLISPKTDKKDLSKYYIISTKLPLKNFNGAIQQIIQNAILN